MDLVTRTPRMPKLGETLEARRFHTGFGGKGANQAIALARLGADPSLTYAAALMAVADGRPAAR